VRWVNAHSKHAAAQATQAAGATGDAA